MMQEFGIKEIASTGKVALFRGNKLIRETRN
jgi:acetolactate synthase small subunit